MATNLTNLSSLQYPDVGSDEDTFAPIVNNTLIGFDAEHAQKSINLDFNDKELQKAILVDTGEKAASVSSSSGVLTIDLTTAQHFYTTLTENVTSVVVTGWSPTGNLKPVIIEVNQDGTGGRTFAFPAGWRWPGGIVPVVTSTAGAVDQFVITSRDAGTTIDASARGQGFA